MGIGYKSPNRWIDYCGDRIVVRCADKFITGSKLAACRLKDVLCLKQDKIQSIHNGIRLRFPNETLIATRNRLGIDQDFDGLVVGIVALMEPRKGHMVFLEALRLLQKENR